MPPRYDGALSRCEEGILKILEIAGTQLCTVHLEMTKAPPQRKMYSGRQSSDISEDTVFPWCSLSKMVIVETLAIIINSLATSSKPENAKYEPLRDAWKTPFVECFNRVSENTMPDLPGNPKVEELVTHFAGAPPLNHIITAPDGTPLMSSDDFLTVAHHLIRDAHGESGSDDRWDYSNGNTILIGLLIEAAARKPLSEIVDELVFKKLKMNSAYIGTRRKDPNTAILHVASPNGTTPIDPPQILSDPLCIIALGVHSNTEDIATFFRSIVHALPSRSNEPGTAGISSFSKPSAGTGYEEDSRYYPCGILTSLHTAVPGDQSLNRSVSPSSDSSNYVLGYEPPENGVVTVFYHAGAVNGFECCSYIIPKWRAFLIVQANTTGHVDATDHISRLVLQSLFDLKSDDGRRADIPLMAEKGAKERAEAFEKLTKSIPDNATAIHSSNLVGTYIHNDYRQAILISERDGKLWARWRGSREVDGRPILSGEMQLVRVDGRTVEMNVADVHFNIDRYGAWKDLRFAVSQDGSKPITSLSRRDPNHNDRFIKFLRSPE